LKVNTALRCFWLGENPVGDAGSAAIKNAIDSNPFAAVRITPAQRMAFLTGHLRRPDQRSLLTRLPLDVIRRILTRYQVAQGRREWGAGERMEVAQEPN
jgi:hypothetical protein